MATESNAQTQFQSFSEFYPYYLAEHANLTCRKLHFIGSWLVLGVIASSIMTGNLALLWLIPVVGYGFAWVGHARSTQRNNPQYAGFLNFKI